jgi:demethylmenaquinone methyltransferase/2-methoxy-6-polyprenyl-1,4-benzoquinol methylase
MFDRIADRYDLLNSLMSVGLHHRWRRRAADVAQLGPGGSALDVCCGTGNLTLELARRVSPGGHVVGCDFSEPMLDLSREKASSRGIANARFEWADALRLPYDAGRFDAVTIGFGARNLSDLDRGLLEMTRVLRPGGRLVILEITHPTRAPLSTFYSFWFDRIVPVLGRLTCEPEAYAYLPESVRSFADPRTLARRMEAAGLRDIRWTILAGGIIAIHSGSRP